MTALAAPPEVIEALREGSPSASGLPKTQSVSVRAAGAPRQMDLGEIVIYGGRRYYVRGVDPVSVKPRHLYLEEVRTGKTVSVAFEQHMAARAGTRRLRLVRKRADGPSVQNDPPDGAQEPDPSP